MRKVLFLEAIARQIFEKENNGRIEFDFQMLQKQVLYFQLLSAILNSIVCTIKLKI